MSTPNPKAPKDRSFVAKISTMFPVFSLFYFCQDAALILLLFLSSLSCLLLRFIALPFRTFLSQYLSHFNYLRPTLLSIIGHAQITFLSFVLLLFFLSLSSLKVMSVLIFFLIPILEISGAARDLRLRAYFKKRGKGRAPLSHTFCARRGCCVPHFTPRFELARSNGNFNRLKATTKTD
jgi:hypothetical protein